jgi:hypothetical protein
MVEVGRPPSETSVQTRQREMAIEHILFHMVRYVEAKEPGFIATIENSLDHLGDPGTDETSNDEAVREIARKLLTSARRT